MPRALLYYLAQARITDVDGGPRDTPTRAASQAHRSRSSRRAHRVRGLPAVVRARAHRGRQRQP